MKKYKFIYIAPQGTYQGKTTYMVCSNRGDQTIAHVGYYPPWKRYVLMDVDFDSIWSSGCLKDVADFIENEIPKLEAAGE